ncbi:hypothetical protein [Candidatus Frankia nodulisporulans]|uniref:hypothetical protein n=1 Tax=Candidatus Frankia nodulisporulans TaxID=2060052 RepID=UPI001CDC05A0|nr:hypothetical protein [Candidatus Frankia nodulisporulans]
MTGLVLVGCGSGSDPSSGRTAAPGKVDLSGVTLRAADQIGQMKGLFNAAGVLKDVPYKIE